MGESERLYYSLYLYKIQKNVIQIKNLISYNFPDENASKCNSVESVATLVMGSQHMLQSIYCIQGFIKVNCTFSFMLEFRIIRYTIT